MQNANTKVRKKGGNLGTFSTFEGAEYISNVAAAISGGIESPLQIILQVFEIDILVSTIILTLLIYFPGRFGLSNYLFVILTTL